VLEGDESAVLTELEKLGGSSGGARPKVHVALDDAGHARSEDHRLPPGFSSWIVKFRSGSDRFSDIGPLEAAYAEAARRARIEMPRTRLIPARKGPGFFATERFDRGPDGTRFHMLSIAGMLDADFRRRLRLHAARRKPGRRGHRRGRTEVATFLIGRR
jgi:serine/threonine-protein kinase HipA